MRFLLSRRLTGILRSMMNPDLDTETRLRLHTAWELAREEYRAHVREHGCRREKIDAPPSADSPRPGRA